MKEIGGGLNRYSMNAHNVRIHMEALRRAAQELEQARDKLVELEDDKHTLQNKMMSDKFDLKYIKKGIRTTKGIIKRLLNKLSTPPHSESHSSE